MMDCVFSELKNVKDTSMIEFVLDSIHKQEFRSLYESFYKKEDFACSEEVHDQDEHHTYLVSESEGLDDTFIKRSATNRQEDQEDKQQEVFQQFIEKNSNGENSQKIADVKEIMEFWDNNGFGFSNVNAKEQLLSWLDDSSFLQPKAVIVKAMNIACANNKRRLSYVVGILKNWENESLLTVEEIESFQEKQKVGTQRKSKPSLPGGRDIPSGFVLDLTAGEEE
jgi:DnaD/phage-associated family protein